MNFDRLLNINGRLLSNKSLIIYQKQEIFKAKTSLFGLQNYLSLQNEKFIKCVDEERELEGEINRRILIDQKEKQLKFVTRKKLKRQSDSTIKCTMSQKRFKMIPNQLDIPELRNKTINAIYYRGETGDIYIGGSEGTLLRHNSKHTRVYKTDRDGDILYITVEGDTGQNLIAVARNKIYVFVTENRAPRHVLELEEIKSAYFNKNSAFVTYANGFIDKFTASTREFTVERVHRGYGAIAPQVTMGNADISQNSSPGNEPLREQEKVDPVTNATEYVTKRGFLCHSDNRVWLLSRKRTVKSEMRVENGVKFVRFFNTIGAIVDRADTLWLIDCARAKALEILYKETFEREVTAVFVSKYRVCVALGDIVVFVEWGTDGREILNNQY